MPGGLRIASGSHLRGQRFETGLGIESKLQPRITQLECTTRYFQRVRRGQDNNDYIYEFVVINPVDVQEVFTVDEVTGQQHMWGCRDNGDGSISFYPHAAYKGGGICYYHGPACVAEPLILASTNYWGPDATASNARTVEAQKYKLIV